MAWAVPRHHARVFCVRCAAEMTVIQGEWTCAATGAGLSHWAATALQSLVAADKPVDVTPSPVDWGVNWYCPADASPLDLRIRGLILCPASGRSASPRSRAPAYRYFYATQAESGNGKQVTDYRHLGRAGSPGTGCGAGVALSLMPDPGSDDVVSQHLLGTVDYGCSFAEHCMVEDGDPPIDKFDQLVLSNTRLPHRRSHQREGTPGR